jgi:hypothetical protein
MSASVRSRVVRRSAAEIRGRFPSSGYVAFHAPRYVYLLDTLRRLRPEPFEQMLDIGRSQLTEMLHDEFGIRVDTLGFQEDGEHETGRHFRMDLNQSADEAMRPADIPAYDVVVMAEVIEHLYTSPATVLRFLRTLVRPGGLLVIQTPNGAALYRRVKLLLGRNPFDLINEDTTNPLHFREYTGKELRQYATDAKFEIVEFDYCNYLDQRYAKTLKPARWRAVEQFILDVGPSTWRAGITAVLRRPVE